MSEPTPQTTPEPSKNKPTPWFWIVMTALVVFLVIAIGFGVQSAKNSVAVPAPEVPSRTPYASPSSAGPRIVVEVTGSAESVDLTYSYGKGTSQQSDASLPYKAAGDAPSGTFLYISAQNKGETGDVTCTITVDGVEVSNNTGSGAYAIAQCDGSA